MKKIISIALIAVLALALLAGCGSSAAPATTTAPAADSAAPASEAPAELSGTGDVITTVSTNPDAIGYASLAALKDNVKALTVGGIAPTEDTVKDGSYVIQRPFVLVTKDGGSNTARRASRLYDGGVPRKGRAAEDKGGHGLGGQPACGHPLGRLRPCGHAVLLPVPRYADLPDGRCTDARHHEPPGEGTTIKVMFPK